MTTNTNFVSNKIDSLVDGYNAQISGLQAGDEIKEINGKKVINQEDVNRQVSKSKGEKVKVLIKRDDKYKYVSFLAYNNRIEEFSIRNAKYLLDKYSLEIGDSRTVSNEFIDDEIALELSNGSILVVYSKD